MPENKLNILINFQRKILGAPEIKNKDISNELNENNVVKLDYYEEYLSVA